MKAPVPIGWRENSSPNDRTAFLQTICDPFGMLLRNARVIVVIAVVGLMALFLL